MDDTDAKRAASRDKARRALQKDPGLIVETLCHMTDEALVQTLQAVFAQRLPDGNPMQNFLSESLLIEKALPHPFGRSPQLPARRRRAPLMSADLPSMEPVELARLRLQAGKRRPPALSATIPSP